MTAIMGLAPTNRHGKRLRKRYGKVRNQLFTFLEHPDVPPDNNGSERELRPTATYRKVTGGFRSKWGADLFAGVRSVIGTARAAETMRIRQFSRSYTGNLSFSRVEQIREPVGKIELVLRYFAILVCVSEFSMHARVRPNAVREQFGVQLQRKRDYVVDATMGVVNGCRSLHTQHAASCCTRASANGFSPRLRLHDSQIQLRLRSAESNGARQRRHGRRTVGAATARGLE